MNCVINPNEIESFTNSSHISLNNQIKQNSLNYTSQNDLLLNNLLVFYKNNNNNNMERMLKIITGESKISLRIVDWFSTNYAKKHFTTYDICSEVNVSNSVTGSDSTSTSTSTSSSKRFKVYVDYKLKLKAYSKKRFDPFCRWDRISIPYDDAKGTFIETTIGQLNFFKWALENKVVDYIEENYDEIEKDMNSYNSTSKRKNSNNSNDSSSSGSATGSLSSVSSNSSVGSNAKTRKKREELSVSAAKSIKKEKVEIVVKFH
jgi:hypothetical protein